MTTEVKTRKSLRQWEAYIEINCNKIPREQLIQEMLNDGYTDTEINQIIDKKKKKALGGNLVLVIIGIVAVLIGIGLSVESYDSAYSSYSGGTYYVYWGLVLSGAVTFIVGIFRILLKK